MGSIPITRSIDFAGGFLAVMAGAACSNTASYALIAQQAERIHGKDEVTSSILVEGSTLQDTLWKKCNNIATTGEK